MELSSTRWHFTNRSRRGIVPCRSLVLRLLKVWSNSTCFSPQISTRISLYFQLKISNCFCTLLALNWNRKPWVVELHWSLAWKSSRDSADTSQRCRKCSLKSCRLHSSAEEIRKYREQMKPNAKELLIHLPAWQYINSSCSVLPKGVNWLEVSLSQQTLKAFGLSKRQQQQLRAWFVQ